ncbi:MAG: hypothetical protein LUC38_01020 [Oscillospiraceae bacterium]|nr:hypothetical protein [Oscillospiraceae bacterium]
MSKRILVIILTVCLAVVGMTVMAVADTWYLEDGDITISATDSGQTVTQGSVSKSDSNPVISNSTPTTSTAYTITVSTSGNASANFTLSNVNISTSGKAPIDVGEYSANITLSGSNILYSSDNPAIHVSSGSLTISGGTSDALSATADTNSFAAAIGSCDKEEFSGSIAITGGVVTGSAALGAGIGSGRLGVFSGSITISGGTVTGSGISGAGIGSGYKGKLSGSIDITNGTVTGSAVTGAGIGSGCNEESTFSGTINISGGTVTGSATGSGAGIGGGEAAEVSGSIIISGGKVTAINSYSGYSGAGIGAGFYATLSGSINITGGTVQASSTASKGIGVGADGTASSTAVYKLACDVVSNNKVLGTLTDLSTVVSGSTSTNTTVSHSWNEGAVTTEATCTEDGVKTYTCSVCGDSYTEVVSATGHTFGTPEIVWASDNTATATVACRSCGAVQNLEVTVTSTTDSYGNTIYTATVTYNGQTYTSEQTVEAVKTTTSKSDPFTTLSRIQASYTGVQAAIEKANSLNPDDYENFSAVTEAIEAVDWSLNALNQKTVNAYAEAIEEAIENLVPVSTTEEVIEIDEPVEAGETDSE